jgi:Beta-glucosidase-related glycosidases
MKRNIEELVSGMTLEEKACMCSGLDFWHLKGIERLRIPSIMVSDGPHGLRKQEKAADHLGVNDSIKAVCFPAACATAASFDPDLVCRMGRVLGEECRAEGVSILLGPAVNIKRSPLCGRNFEYYSEDPYLTGKIAAAFIRGVQEWDVGTSIKHFAVNNQEYFRMSCSSDLSERTLREIYLPAFEEAVKEAEPWTVMCSYNKINGTFAAENKYLLTGILRDEWNFKGCVMTDWGAINDRVRGLAAGTELEMPGSKGINDAQIVAALKSGELDEAILDRAVIRILNIVFAYADKDHPEAKFDRDADRALAVEIEKECAVLLENNGILPLKAGQKIAYIGDYAAKPRFQGGGSSHINCSKVTSALEAANTKGRNVTYAMGYQGAEDVTKADCFAQAVKAAREADAAVVFAGLPDSCESEGYDRSNMRLPACQNALIEQIITVQPNTVVVLHNGSPVECPWAGRAAAVLEMYLGGQGVGEAADALLWGEANPCGRLPETFPLQLEDNPSFLNFPGDSRNVNYAEGIYVGYRYYDSKKAVVRWPFGHGLSYTTFAYSNPKVSSAVMDDDSTVIVTVDITNTGNVTGKEVVQLYIQDVSGTAGRPEKELKGIAKVPLAPGERKTVAMEINARSLSWYNEALGDWYAAPGTYKLLLAHSSREVLEVTEVNFTTKKLIPFIIDRNTTVGFLLNDLRTAAPAQQLVEPVAAVLTDGENASEAISNKMLRQMMDSVPLRALKNFSGMSEEALNSIILQMNALIK